MEELENKYERGKDPAHDLTEESKEADRTEATSLERKPYGQPERQKIYEGLESSGFTIPGTGTTEERKST